MPVGETERFPPVRYVTGCKIERFCTGRTVRKSESICPFLHRHHCASTSHHVRVVNWSG